MLRLPRSSHAHSASNTPSFHATNRHNGIRQHPVKSAQAVGRQLGLVLTLSLIAAGCATSPERAEIEPDTSQNASPEIVEMPKQTPVPTAPVEPVKPPVNAQPNNAQPPKVPAGATDEMTTVSVYTMDDQCLDFVSKPVQVSSDSAVSEAVQKAMGDMDYNAFKLEGYEVSVSGSTAIVDMRLSPGSERQFVSLSSCEQQSLFGSIERTLLNNPDLNVNAVKFTDGGKEIVL